MNKRTFSWIIFTFLVLTFSSCKKEDDVNPKDGGFTTADLNEWLYQGMQTVYLWNDKIPSFLNPATEKDPIAFFEKMVYREEDRWSWITEDWNALKAELQGVPEAVGISPAFGLIGKTNNVVIAVEFVYPGSPADRAGLKRGDVIVQINGQPLTPENYYQLYSQPSLTLGLGTADADGIYPSGNEVSLTSEVIETDPIIYHGILDINGIKTGYLVFSEFISGIDLKFRNELGLLFDDFAAEGVTEMIVDLRYNPGGEIDMAAFLASALAPASVVETEKVLVHYVYNNEMQDYYISEDGPDSEELYLNFPANEHNLDLSRVHFLTTGGTASASELVIIGLDPYMEVVQIGETTHGKYTGAWVIPDTEDPARHDYAMVPIVMKYSNADGFTDFADGILPDHEVVEDMLHLKEFGDLSDPMLAKAVELLGGTPAATGKKSTTTGLKRIFSEKELMKSNLFVEKDLNPAFFSPVH